MISTRRQQQSLRGLWALLAACFAVALFGSVSFAAAPGAPPALAPSAVLPMTSDQYSQALGTAQASAELAAKGEPAAGVATRAALLQVAQRPVQSGPQALIFVDNRPLLRQMQVAQQASNPAESASDWTEIAREIGEIKAGLPAAEGSSNTARASAAATLSAREFASLPVPPTTVWEKILNWIGDQLAKIHWRGPRVKTPDYVTNIVPEAILTLVIVFAVGLIIYFGLQWWRNRNTGKAATSAAETDIALSAEEKALVAAHDYARLRSLADEAAERGDYRSAFRLVFLATLVFLDAEGAIKLDRSKTNWEYLRSVAGHDDLRSALRPVVRDFDRIWYGDAEAVADDFHRASDAYDAARRMVNEWQPAVLPAGRSLSAS